MRIVSYIRVSTARQGASGLGLEAQTAAIEAYARNTGAEIIRSFVEVESGKKADRPELAKAIHYAKVTGSKLVIAKLDRLSRDAHFLLGLRNSGADIEALDVPGSNTLIFGILAVVAQNEREMISQRTKVALAALKARGVRLGNPNGARALKAAGKGCEASLKARAAGADSFATNILPVIEDIRSSGVTTLLGIANQLNERHIQTRQGGKWYPTSVKNLLERAA